MGERIKIKSIVNLSEEKFYCKDANENTKLYAILIVKRDDEEKGELIGYDPEKKCYGLGKEPCLENICGLSFPKYREQVECGEITPLEDFRFNDHTIKSIQEWDRRASVLDLKDRRRFGYFGKEINSEINRNFVETEEKILEYSEITFINETDFFVKGEFTSGEKVKFAILPSQTNEEELKKGRNGKIICGGSIGGKDFIPFGSSQRPSIATAKLFYNLEDIAEAT
ncbi:MAG: hypothetical protein ACW99A_21560 [Candidatus Kariarchaeaceae archaeon]|jgi:hypothetical protein